MYSRAVIALAVAAAAAPALSAPLAARDAPATDSGALNLSTIGKAVNIGNDVINGFNAVKNFFE